MKKTTYIKDLTDNNIDMTDFLDYLSQGDAESKENVVNYYGITVKYNKNGQISDIRPGNDVGFNISEGRMKEAIKLLKPENQKKKVSSVVLFSPFNVDKSFRVPGVFNITPISIESPRPKEMIADHPFIMEFYYDSSENWIINSKRKSRKIKELILLLNLLLNGYVKTQNSSFKNWTLVKSPSNEYESMWLQEGYRPKGNLDGDENKFSNKAGKIAEESLKEYYQFQLGIEYGSSLTIPDNLELSVKKYFLLCNDDKKIFLRSLYWYDTTNKVSRYSLSSAYIALINSIECFIETKIIRNCDKCNQNIYDKSVSEGFRQVIDSYANGVANKAKNDFYSLRSALVHGSKIFPQDDFQKSFLFTPHHFKHSINYSSAEHVARIIIYNWLHSRING